MNQTTTQKLVDRSILIARNMRGKHKHFSYLLRRNKVVSFGVNKDKSHTLTLKFGHYDQRIHSELDCIKNFPHKISDIKNHSLLNVRVRRNGTVAMSRPCRNCLVMLDYFGIKECFYSDERGEIIKLT